MKKIMLVCFALVSLVSNSRAAGDIYITNNTSMSFDLGWNDGYVGDDGYGDPDSLFYYPLYLNFTSQTNGSEGVGPPTSGYLYFYDPSTDTQIGSSVTVTFDTSLDQYYTLTESGGDPVLTLDSIPEPTTNHFFFLLLLTATILWLRSRRRLKTAVHRLPESSHTFYSPQE